jgi:hypothetical protein
MPEKDWFAEIIEKYGELRSVRKVTPQDASQYANKVPYGLIRFWLDHGRGNIGGTEQWICDPAIFTPLIDFLFKDDPEFAPEDLTVFAYDAFGELLLWHKTKRFISIGINTSGVYRVGVMFDPKTGKFSEPDYKDWETGLPMSEDFQLGRAMFPPPPPNHRDEEGEDMFPRAVENLGPLEHGQIYGLFPALQFGGSAMVENLRKVGVVEYALIAAQAKRFMLEAMTPPQPPEFPFGYSVPIRPVGKQ